MMMRISSSGSEMCSAKRWRAKSRIDGTRRHQEKCLTRPAGTVGCSGVVPLSSNPSPGSLEERKTMSKVHWIFKQKSCHDVHLWILWKKKHQYPGWAIDLKHEAFGSTTRRSLLIRAASWLIAAEGKREHL
jgi:hypothetical protein